MSAAATEQDGPRVDAMDRAVLRLADAVGEFIEYWGFKSILGRLWTLLALHREPLTQTQLADALGVSRALVSGAMSELHDRGLVRPLGSSRKSRYEAVIDVWPSISDVLRSREWQLIDNARLALEAAIEQADLDRANGRELRYDAGRMKLLLAMTEMAQRFLRMVISLRTPTSAKKLSSWAGKASALVRERMQALLDERRR